MAMDQSHNEDLADATPSALDHNGGGAVWTEFKHDDAPHDDTMDGPTFAQAPVVYLDAEMDVDGIKADSADLLALKSRRRPRPATPTGSSAPRVSTAFDSASTLAASMPTSADASVAFSSFELSYVAPTDAAGHISVVAPPHYDAQPNPGIPHDHVGAFLQSLTLTFSANPSTVEYLRGRLSEMGYDSVLALAFVSDQELAMAGIAYPQDQLAIRNVARHEFASRKPPSPPDLYQMVTMSKWLILCGIPRPMATLYTTHLQRFGYDSVQHFESIGHDSRALGVFRPGHYHLFKYHLERVLQQQHQQQQHYQQANAVSHGYGMYYGSSGATASSGRPEDFHSTLLDDLVPSGGFPISPAVRHPQQAYEQSAYYGAPTANVNVAGSSFTQMMHDGSSSGGPPIRILKDVELRLLYEAVNMDDKSNPCRRGKKVDWSVIATNGMGDPRFSVLAQYTAEELEQNYVQNHELPLHATARNTEWSSELIKLLWKVSQDTRCKNGTKTMWEQIAQGRTGVPEYTPLAKFTNSQLRSRYRTEFGDKRPQSRKKAREEKNALAKAALAAGQPLDQKAAAKQKAAAVKARKAQHDSNRPGLGDSEPLAV